VLLKIATAAAIERFVLQELRVGDESVGQILRIAVGVLIQSTIVGRQTEAEITVVERVVRSARELRGFLAFLSVCSVSTRPPTPTKLGTSSTIHLHPQEILAAQFHYAPGN
jgi:hypothetical protein